MELDIVVFVRRDLIAAAEGGVNFRGVFWDGEDELCNLCGVCQQRDPMRGSVRMMCAGGKGYKSDEMDNCVPAMMIFTTMTMRMSFLQGQGFYGNDFSSEDGVFVDEEE